MFFLLSKFFHFLLSPVSWIFLFLLFTLFSKNQVKRKKFIAACFFLLFFFSNTFIFDRFMQAWEIKSIRDEAVPVCDAGILLTGMATYDPQVDRLEFNDRTDRLMQAIRLYKQQKIKKLILCGGPVTFSGSDTLDAPRLKKFLVSIGIPENDLILEMKSRNTHENALFLKPLLTQIFRDGKFILITSAAHMKRAGACFHKQGIPVLLFSTDRYSGPVKYDFDYLFIPSSATLFNWEKLIHEWVGMIGYAIMGYL